MKKKLYTRTFYPQSEGMKDTEAYRARAKRFKIFKAAGLDWTKKSLAYHTDCNTRFLRKPDAKRRQLAEESRAAFDKVMALLK